MTEIDYRMVHDGALSQVWDFDDGITVHVASRAAHTEYRVYLPHGLTDEERCARVAEYGPKSESTFTDFTKIKHDDSTSAWINRYEYVYRFELDVGPKKM